MYKQSESVKKFSREQNWQLNIGVVLNLLDEGTWAILRQLGIRVSHK